MRRYLRINLIWILLWPSMAFAGAIDPVQVNEFIVYMSDKHGYNDSKLQILLSKANYSEKVLTAISKPAEALPWYKYRKIFIQNSRIKKGGEFWMAYKSTLDKAHRLYGVPPQIIVAIIGIETRYGRNKGNYKILDSLTTLAFHYPKRGKFFRSELEQFLLLVEEQNADPLTLKGSYAGAMGIPQFIASSYRHYAVDFDGDGKKDLWDNPVDAIGSVANYLNKNGWRSGQPVTVPLQVKDKRIDEIISDTRKPDIKLTDLRKYGIKLERDIAEQELLKVMKFNQINGIEYWAGMYNFYVITCYNHSKLYAMAVYQLSELIKAEYQK